MNIVHLHLLLNHVPVLGVLFAALILFVAVLRHSGELAKLSLAMLALAGATAIFVFLTGEPAQEAVEKLPGLSDRLVDRHEDAARIATIVTGCIGALASGALIAYRRRSLPRWVTMFALVAAVGSTGLMGYTANLGGQIRHTEIRSPSASGNLSAPEREGKER